MKQQYAVIVLFALFLASGLTSLDRYRETRRMVNEDMDRALAITMQEQQSDVISIDTLRTFNSHLQIAELRGKATLAVDARSQKFKAYARCSEAAIFGMSDQRPAALLWTMTVLWAMFTWYRRTQRLSAGSVIEGDGFVIEGNSFGGLTFLEAEKRFFATNGDAVQLTPMQQQLMEMFYQSPAYTLTKAEICAALWPGKPDASDTLYTLIKRLTPVVEQHSNLKIESDRGKSYRLTIK